MPKILIYGDNTDIHQELTPDQAEKLFDFMLDNGMVSEK